MAGRIEGWRTDHLTGDPDPGPVIMVPYGAPRVRRVMSYSETVRLQHEAGRARAAAEWVRECYAMRDAERRLQAAAWRGLAVGCGILVGGFVAGALVWALGL